MTQGNRLRDTALPSFITLGNVACGVGAILLSTHALLKDDANLLFHAAWWLVLATVFDALDGKVARMTRTASHLGSQLDSLADAITFGVAPTIVLTTLVQMEGPALGIHMHPRLLIVAPIIFALCAVLRLARYNVESETKDHSKDSVAFSGLPSPAAAGIPISLILLYFGLADPNFVFPVDIALLEIIREVILRSAPFLLILSAVLMVTQVPYPHFFSWMTRDRPPFKALAETAVIFGLLMVEPELALFFSGFGFAFIPAIRALPALLKRNSSSMSPPDGNHG
mgnify:CR=1 FL=1